MNDELKGSECFYSTIYFSNLLLIILLQKTLNKKIKLILIARTKLKTNIRKLENFPFTYFCSTTK